MSDNTGHDFEWFLNNADAYDSLTTEQLHLLGRGELVEYNPETPVVEADPVVKTVVEPDPIVTEPTVDPELEASRAKVEQLETLSATQADLITNLKAAKVEDAATGTQTTEAQEDVLAGLKKDYPELAETLVPALQKMIEAGVSLKTAELTKQFNEALAPIQKSAEDSAYEAHFSVITDAHPDFRELMKNGSIDKWIDTLPGYAKSGATHVIEAGSAKEVVELFDQYKAAHAAPAPVPAKSDAEIKAAADAAISKAKAPKLKSLTDVPASQVAHTIEEPTTADGWSRKFANMTPEAILRSL